MDSTIALNNTILKLFIAIFIAISLLFVSKVISETHFTTTSIETSTMYWKSDTVSWGAGW